jgi:epoxide hydrolase-like protein
MPTQSAGQVSAASSTRWTAGGGLLFTIRIAEEAIADLRRRIAAWRRPEREPVDDQSQGVQLATAQDLANYWVTEYDWRRCEAKLNALPST